MSYAIFLFPLLPVPLLMPNEWMKTWTLISSKKKCCPAKDPCITGEMHISSFPFQSDTVSDTNFARNIIYFLKARQSNPMPSRCQETHSTFPTFEMRRFCWESRTTVPGWGGGGQDAEGPRGLQMAVARKQGRGGEKLPLPLPPVRDPAEKHSPWNTDPPGMKRSWAGRLINGVSPISVHGKAVLTSSEEADGGRPWKWHKRNHWKDQHCLDRRFQKSNVKLIPILYFFSSMWIWPLHFSPTPSPLSLSCECSEQYKDLFHTFLRPSPMSSMFYMNYISMQVQHQNSCFTEFLFQTIAPNPNGHGHFWKRSFTVILKNKAHVSFSHAHTSWNN